MPSSERRDVLDLKTAAEQLGVHYQTAYRWVRTGRLPAELVGGSYLVDATDVARLRDDRATPRPPKAPGPRRRARSEARVYEALVAGDEAAVRQIARSLVDEGLRVADLIQQVLVPPLRTIGGEWHEGRLSIWVEHRASAIVERVLGELVTNPRGRRRGIAVVAAISGDLHSLPTTMATVTLRDDNWTVHHLGADMPSTEIVGFCAEHEVDVAVLTVTNGAVASAAAAVAEELERGGTPTVVGAPGRTLAELEEAVRDAARR